MDKIVVSISDYDLHLTEQMRKLFQRKNHKKKMKY